MTNHFLLKKSSRISCDFFKFANNKKYTATAPVCKHHMSNIHLPEKTCSRIHSYNVLFARGGPAPGQALVRARPGTGQPRAVPGPGPGCDWGQKTNTSTDPRRRRVGPIRHDAPCSLHLLFVNVHRQIRRFLGNLEHTWAPCQRGRGHNFKFWFLARLPPS